MNFRALIMRDTLLVAGGSALVALLFNAVRPEGGIPFVATTPYEIFVPCPEPLGEVGEIDPESALLAAEEINSGRTLVLDAGDKSEFAGWHVKGAWNVPFDYIEPVDDVIVRRVAASGAIRVIVYGDGNDPDSGRELARELAGRGISNVFSVKGGGSAIKAIRGAR